MKTYSERTQSILQKAEVQKKARNKRIKTISILSSVAAALFAFNLVLFVPYTTGGTDITKYSSSEYYSVIQQLYDLTYDPHTTNNFIEWFGDLHFGLGAQAPDVAPGGEAPTSPGIVYPAVSDDNSSHGNDNNYNEVTNNQTAGVTEGDLFKRSDTHIYYLGHTLGEYDYIINEDKGGSVQIIKYKEDTLDLCVYSIAGEESRKVGEYKIEPNEGESFAFNTGDREMYLSKDLKTVTVVTPCSLNNFTYTAVIDLDVSDLDNITEKNRSYVSGRYVSSRVTDDEMLIVTNFSVPWNADFSNEATFVPQYGKLGEMKLLPAKDIVCPENASNARYTVVCSLDGEHNATDSVALLSFSQDVYVSANNLYTTREYIESVKTENEYQLTYSYERSEIRIVPYGDGDLGETRAVTVAGRVLDRFCLDEYEGVLRAATTVRAVSSSYTFGKDETDPYKDIMEDRCLLYCIDLDTLETAALVRDFAPVGESVKSARFYGNTAYVCTASVNYGSNGNVWITDPVFAFDLTDLGNITYKDTGTIPGYSLTLIGFTDDTLLGIGYGKDSETLKVELYEQTENDVTPLTAYELSEVFFSSEFKAHFIDRKNGLVGLGVRGFGWVGNGTNYEYKLLRYDGYELKEILSVELKSRDNDEMRATYIDGYIYILGNDDFIVAKLS